MKRNDGAVVRTCQQQLDTLNRGIFRALCRRTSREAFDTPTVNIQALEQMNLPDHPEINLATTILTVIVQQQVEYFNVGKTMNATQVAAMVDDIIDVFPQLTLEEVATCFRRKRRTAQIFDRIDPNILMGWLYDYDSERDEFCENDARVTQKENDSGEAMFYGAYMEWLKSEVAKGNKDAIEAKKSHEELLYMFDEEKRREKAFQEYKKKYEETGTL